ncbi:NINE protein [Mycolicibacterium thermoresistibile]
MSEPPQYGDEWHGQQRPPYPYQQGQCSAGYPDPTAPYGRHPITGEPLSDKSKVIAGLLQLIGLFGLLGFGRMYIGQVGFGVAQLLIGLVVGLVTCGYGFAIPAIWGVVDAVLIFTGNARDSYGRPLRDGT